MSDFVDGQVLDPFTKFSKADDNIIQTFRLDVSSLRGRMVRLGSVLDDILAPHNYPEPVAHLVAETVTLALLLSAMLKYDGIFTLQTKGDGPVSMLVADVTSDGNVRGCASFDPERLDHACEQLSALEPHETSQNHLAQFLGRGYIAFTVDQGAHTDRYQGIVELQGASLVDCVQHYFSQSEQINTGIKMAVGLRKGKWRAGGLMLQKIPEEGGKVQHKGNLQEDDWRRSMILMDSCSDDEFLDETLHSNILLARLFHEEEVRVYKPTDIQKKCRCSADKVEGVMTTLSDDDLDYMQVDGKIVFKCEFCSHEYVYLHKDVMRDRSKKSIST